MIIAKKRDIAKGQQMKELKAAEIYAKQLAAKDKKITELEVKLDSLRDDCRKQIEHFRSKDIMSDYDWVSRDRTMAILRILDEGKE